ncbi:MAG: tetratricopeptide repeat protein, partial [Cyclobacteriaceae bacterium]
MHFNFLTLSRSLLLIFLIIPGLLAAQEWEKSYALAHEKWGISWSQTVAHLKEAESSARNDLGIFDPDYLIILNDLGLALYEAGKIDEAIQILDQSLQYRQEILDIEDNEVLIAKLNLARVAQYRNPDKSIEHFLALSHSKDRMISLKASKSLYDLYTESGEIESAAALVKMMDSADTESIYLKSLLQADVYRRKGMFKASEEELLKLENSFGNKISSDLLVQSARALYYDQKGMLAVERHAFAEAEAALIKALETKEYLGRPKEEFIVTYNNLARLYQEFGLYQKALDAIDEALAYCTHYCEKLLQNKASIHLITGNMLEAELIYNDIYDNYSFKTPADELEFLLNYANTYRKGSMSRTNPALEKAFELVSEYGEDLPDRDLGHYYASRGSWLIRNGDIEEAINAFERSRQYYLSVYGEESFMLRKTEMYLGLCYIINRDVNKGIAILRIVDQREKELIQYVYPLMSRSEQMVFMEDLHEDLDLFYSALVPEAKINPDLRNLLFEKQLIYKGLTLQAIRSTQDSTDYQIPPDIKDEYSSLRRRLARIYTEGRTEEASFEQEDLARLRDLETHIARETGVQLSGLPDLDSIRSNLDPDEVLIEVIRYRSPGTEVNKNSVNYVGLIVDPTSKELGMASFTDGDQLESRQLKLYLNSIKYEVRDSLSYGKLWEPLAFYTRGKRVCYLVSDGLYYKVNPAALWNPVEKKYLGEDLSIRQLNNAGELISIKSTKSRLLGEKDVLLVGDPNLSDLSGSRFTNLPGTREEIRNLENKFRRHGWEVRSLSGENATKTSLLSAEYGSVIHF